MAVQVQPSIFNTVPKSDLFGFFNKGKIQYKEVVNTLHLSKKEMSQAARISVNDIHYEQHNIPKEIKDFLKEMIWLFHVTHNHFKDENKVIQWMQSPNPICGGFSPKDMICMGQYKKLVRIVSSYMEGSTP